MNRIVLLTIVAGFAGIIILASLGGCRADKAPAAVGTLSAQPVTESAPQIDVPEAVSLLGAPLHRPELPVAVRIQRERDLEKAHFEYDRDPHNEETIIWLGRRLAYLGRYRDAIDIFSNGLAIHPESY
jgi:hypothetical protein